jgi:hypothetical protein
VRSNRIKRDKLLGVASGPQPSGGISSPRHATKWFIGIASVAIILIALAFAYLSGQKSAEQTAAIAPLSDGMRALQPSNANVEPASDLGLTDAEREYRNQVEDEELVRLLNNQKQRTDGRAVDLTAPFATAKAKGKKAVKDLRALDEKAGPSISKKKAPEGVE